jgi:hypothetical protein
LTWLLNVGGGPPQEIVQVDSVEIEDWMAILLYHAFQLPLNLSLKLVSRDQLVASARDWPCGRRIYLPMLQYVAAIRRQCNRSTNLVLEIGLLKKLLAQSV